MRNIERTDGRSGMTDFSENNEVRVSGILSCAPALSHNVYGEDFVNFSIEVPRLSGTVDVLPATASALTAVHLRAGDPISVHGQLRSYNRIVEGASRLDLRLFARRIDVNAAPEFENDIELTGYVCKPPAYRTTPFGREITDIMLAVNRRYNKSDYIPCIIWGRNARRAMQFEVGDKLNIKGRLQSREYEKRLEDGEVLKRTAYELSVSSVSLERDSE